MDFLTQLSIRYTEKAQVLDEEDPEDSGKIFFIGYIIYNADMIWPWLLLLNSSQRAEEPKNSTQKKLMQKVVPEPWHWIKGSYLNF